MDEYEGADEGFRGSARWDAEHGRRRRDAPGEPGDFDDLVDPAGPAGAGVRPVHRFPLPGYGDPSEDPSLPPVVARTDRPAAGVGVELPHWADAPTGEVPLIVPTRRSGSVETSSTAYPGDEPGAPGAWRAGDSTPAVGWRDRERDWDDPGYEPARLGGDEVALGALDEERGDPEDLFSFDGLDVHEPIRGQAPTGRAAAPPTGPMSGLTAGSTPGVYTLVGQDRDRGVAPPPGARRSRGRDGDRSEPGHRRQAGRPRDPVPGDPGFDVDGRSTRSGGTVRLVTGVGIGVLLLIFLKIGPAAALVLVALLVTMALAELYGVLRRAGYQPATLVGLVATVCLMVAVYMKGEAAFGVVIAITTVAALLWYLLGVERGRPTVNLAATIVGFVWVGVLGSYAALLLSPHLFPNRHGEAFFLGAVLATVAYDVGALVVGARQGRHRMAPSVSPNKTWEGMIGGVVTCLVVSGALVGRIHPWGTANALALGVVVCVLAPLGDLCESLVKRDLGIKDMGSILPGHGGVLDRLDALLFVIPATFYLVRLLHIGVA